MSVETCPLVGIHRPAVDASMQWRGYVLVRLIAALPLIVPTRERTGLARVSS
jgi:hypothetical protein